jgi:nitronate monooxygenase
MVREEPSFIREQIRSVRKLTQRNFGVNIIPAATDSHLLKKQIQTILKERIKTVVLFWDVDESIVGQFRDRDVTVLHQVGSIEAAIAAEKAGANAIIAQGYEAGGHVHGTISTMSLTPQVVDVVSVPVIASGGIADGRGLVAALALGAQGIHCGTPFLATDESFAHAYHKERIKTGRSDQTTHTEVFHINWPPHSPTRVMNSQGIDLKNATAKPENAEKPPSAIIAYEGGRPIQLYSTDSPLQNTQGDYEKMPIYAGQSVGLISDVVSAATRVDQIMEQATEALTKLRSEQSTSS